MKRINKKGFTIVELVIVIAILAAVLIPTFSGVVEKANKSAALQGARNVVALMEVEEDAQVPNGTYYITFENGELKPNSITDVVPETLGGRLYEHNDQLEKTTSSVQSQGEHCWVGITLPTLGTYGEDYPLTEQDHWLYIRAEEVINAPKTFKVNDVVYTCKVVLGTEGSFA